jgi:hypothetical protein
MKIKNIQIVLTIISITIIGFACSKGSDTANAVATTCNPNTSFSQTVLPILNTNCNLSGCHDPNNAAELNNFTVVHDNAAQIKASVVSGRMPKGKFFFNATDKAALICWIDNGAKNN